MLNHDNLNLPKNFGPRPSLALLGEELYRLVSAANGTALVIVDHSCGGTDLGGITIATGKNCKSANWEGMVTLMPVNVVRHRLGKNRWLLRFNRARPQSGKK